eukprot:TRINITY_DN6688_c0_g1_i1.p1 TRINITY_DN6688_c0_g1~~TRINITY_DN6688_c0_g1_i1.p1  ORF type:complete len:380 (-),score=35.35 TRINITY_DN6688_c0_g1_i1:133-1272(-)
MLVSQWIQQWLLLCFIGAHARRVLQVGREHGKAGVSDSAWPTLEAVKKAMAIEDKPAGGAIRRFFVFLDVYDLVTVNPLAEGGVAGALAGSAAGSVAGSMAGGPVGSVAGSAAGAVGGAVGGAGINGAVAAGGNPLVQRELPQEIPKPFRGALGKGGGGGGGLLQVEEESWVGQNMSAGRAFTHSEVALCDVDQFQQARDVRYLTRMQGSVIPEKWSKAPSRSHMRCMITSYGASPCITPACGASMRYAVLSSVTSPPYGARTRIALGVARISQTSRSDDTRKVLWDLVLSKRDQWKGAQYDFVGHNCNNYARWFVRCILDMSMPSQLTLGANHAVSSTPWLNWLGSIGASAAGGLVLGPLGLAAGPLIFMATPSEICI